MAGYHNREIVRGVYGEFSKIREEFEEFDDAVEQNNILMSLVELSDLIGAIEGYAVKYGISLDDLIIMKNATKRAFEDGTRNSRKS